MKTLRNNLIQVLMISGLMVTSLFVTNYMNPHLETQVVFASTFHRIRIDHAKELLGPGYGKSIVRTGEMYDDISDVIYTWAKERLPRQFKSDYKRVAHAIIEESFKYQFDPIFLMAVIQGESSFDPRMRGRFGEIGLMQIKPDTAEWISEMNHMRWLGQNSLFDPVTNIRYGAAYLSWLRNKFGGHAQLYVAAYNMGQRNVRNAVEKDVWPKEYPIHVMKNYFEFYAQLNVKFIASGRKLASL